MWVEVDKCSAWIGPREGTEVEKAEKKEKKEKKTGKLEYWNTVFVFLFLFWFWFWFWFVFFTLNFEL